MACTPNILPNLDNLSNRPYDRHVINNMIENPPHDPAEEDGPDAITAPLSGGPPVLQPKKDYESLAAAEEEEDDGDD